MMPTQFDWIYKLYVEQVAERVPIDQRTKLQPTDFYYENGYMVMTEQYHLRRGHCCGNGCKHCPFQPKHEKDNTQLQDIYLKD